MGARSRAASLLRFGLSLEYVTLAWNVVGTVAVINAAVTAHSVALAGFGFDSLIEIFASIIVVWQLRGTSERRKRPALRAIGFAFYALAFYIFVRAIYVLLADSHSLPSPFGAIWLIATVAAMLLLAWGKSWTGRQLGNAVLQTEARVTLVDAYLAAAILTGLALNALLRWWWADPAASLVIVYYGVREGSEAWRHASEFSV